MRNTYFIIIIFLFFFAFSPNFQLFNVGIIIHDYLAVFIFSTLVGIHQKRIRKRNLILAVLFLIFSIVYALSQRENSLFVLARAFIYLGIPLILFDIASRSDSFKKYSVSYGFFIRRACLGVLSLYFIVDSAQRLGLIKNIFQYDYYMRALNSPMSEGFYRYAWFDEHHVAVPALIALTVAYTQGRLFIVTAVYGIYHGSLMIAAGLLSAILMRLGIFVSILSTLLLISIFAFLYFYTEIIFAFYDLQLRLINWQLHLSEMDSLDKLILGYGDTPQSLEGIPIDNFIIRYLCDLGILGLFLIFSMLFFIYRYSGSGAKFFIVVFCGSAVFNDLFAYPPVLAVFSGGLSLIILSRMASGDQIWRC